MPTLSPRVSVIIPVHNEEASILSCIRSACDSVSISLLEVLVVDSASSDATQSLVEEYALKNKSIRYLKSTEAGRAAQMNFGASQAKGSVFLFVHADTLLRAGFEQDLDDFWLSDKQWGFCNVHFDSPKIRFRILAFMINARSRLTQIATGDQSQFIKREVFRALDGFPSQPLMEDVELSKYLKRESKPFFPNTPCQTEARKWESEGFLKTIFLMWRLRYRYWRGVDAAEIYKSYYRS